MSVEIEGTALIDTNILIYALYQDKDSEKYNIASNVLLSLGRSEKGLLSIQTLHERVVEGVKFINPFKV